MYNVEFPNLRGLSFQINPIAFSFGGLEVYWYGIIIGAGFLLSIYLAFNNAKRFSMNSEDIIDIIFYSAPVGIICARLYYVIFNWSQFKNNFLSIFNLRTGGLGIYGGIIGGVLVAVFVARKKKINPLKLLDYLVPYVALAQSIGRWGNFINQEAFGVNTNLPWGMMSERTISHLAQLQEKGFSVNPLMPVHPTFIYESLWNLGLFFFLINYRKKNRKEGEVFFLYMLLYGFARFFIEGLRSDSLYIGAFRASQIIAVLFFILFLTLFIIKKTKKA